MRVDLIHDPEVREAVEAPGRRQGAEKEALAAAPRLLWRAARAARPAPRRTDCLEHL